MTVMLWMKRWKVEAPSEPPKVAAAPDSAIVPDSSLPLLPASYPAPTS
jgi:hypothetical protein